MLRLTVCVRFASDIDRIQSDLAAAHDGTCKSDSGFDVFFDGPFDSTAKDTLKERLGLLPYVQDFLFSVLN